MTEEGTYPGIQEKLDREETLRRISENIKKDMEFMVNSCKLDKTLLLSTSVLKDWLPKEEIPKPKT